MQMMPIEVRELNPSGRPKHGEGGGTGCEGSRKEPLAKIAKALKRTEGATRRNARSEGVSLSVTRKKRTCAKKR